MRPRLIGHPHPKATPFRLGWSPASHELPLLRAQPSCRPVQEPHLHTRPECSPCHPRLPHGAQPIISVTQAPPRAGESGLLTGARSHPPSSSSRLPPPHRDPPRPDFNPAHSTRAWPVLFGVSHPTVLACLECSPRHGRAPALPQGSAGCLLSVRSPWMLFQPEPGPPSCFLCPHATSLGLPHTPLYHSAYTFSI